MDLYNAMKDDMKNMKALAWTDEGFSLDPYDLVFLPGGHEKGVVQVINSPITHRLIADYFPKTRKPSKKSVAAICHGVMVLSESSLPDGKSVIHDATTTALPGFMEQSIFWGTRAFLGDYYKTYGAGSDSVQTSVRFSSSSSYLQPNLSCRSRSVWMIRQNSIITALDLARTCESTEALSLITDLRACIVLFVRTRSIIILVGAFHLMPFFWPRKRLRW